MQSSVLIKINNVRKHYTTKKNIVNALNGVSFDIYRGEIMSLLGSNGAGKTTLSSLLATLHPASSGDITCNGKSIYDDINHYRRQMGFCPQDSNLNDDLTVEQNLKAAGEYFGLSPEVIKAWHVDKNKPKQQGRQFKYSELAIETSIIIKTVYSLPYRATEGFLCSIMDLMDFGLDVTDYTSICRRAGTLKLQN